MNFAQFASSTMAMPHVPSPKKNPIIFKGGDPIYFSVVGGPFQGTYQGVVASRPPKESVVKVFSSELCMILGVGHDNLFTVNTQYCKHRED